MERDEDSWGDFSEWLSRVDGEIGEGERLPISGSEDGERAFMAQLYDVVNQWIERIEEAPTTTWQEELSVRGMDPEPHEALEEEEVSARLWDLIAGLAGMRVFLNHTDHLSDREVYALLLQVYLVRPVAQVVFDERSGCIVDLVDSSDPDDVRVWLRYYAGKAERAKWAETHPDENLPEIESPPFRRDNLLPKP